MTLTALLTVGLIVLVTIVYDTWFNNPPLAVTSLDPDPLGIFCAGEQVPINNEIAIDRAIVMFYYVSTLDRQTHANLIGTQRAFTDILHPAPAKFVQQLPWTVPDLPPGEYTRVFAVRNVEGTQRTAFIVRDFEITEGCQ